MLCAFVRTGVIVAGTLDFPVVAPLCRGAACSNTSTQRRDYSFCARLEGFGEACTFVIPSAQSTRLFFSVTNKSGTLWASASDVLKLTADGFDAAAHISAPFANDGKGATGFAGEVPRGTRSPIVARPTCSSAASVPCVVTSSVKYRPAPRKQRKVAVR